MKYFSEVLLIGLLVGILTFCFAMYQIIAEAIATGIVSEFATGYAMGFATPILIGIWIITKIFRTRTPRSGLNTGMDRMLDSIEGVV